MSININKDKNLLKQLNQGDNQAFLVVYDYFAPKIFRYIYYQVGRNKSLAEELAQQSFFKAWEYISSGKKPIENIQAFLYRVARNLVVDLWRSKQKESLPLLDELIETTEGSQRWQEEIDAKVSVEFLEKTLDNIHEQYREVLVMRYLQDMTVTEISKVLAKDKNNIYVLIHRATRALRKELEDK
jgi:RNA polymerase sigma-70 factor, ECF subfamily